MTQASEDREVARLALEIKRYLAGHPNAADSLDGVLGWWLTRQRVEDAAVNVRLALEWLVEQGHAEKRELAGQVIYTSKTTGNDRH
jgi:hypothetical protein